MQALTGSIFPPGACMAISATMAQHVEAQDLVGLGIGHPLAEA